MLELGKVQSLVIVKELEFGVYLGEVLNASMNERVLLPKKQIPQGSKIGDSIEVFLYKVFQRQNDCDDKQTTSVCWGSGETASFSGYKHWCIS